MGSQDYVPDKGDIVWVDFNPQIGHEQAGKRPAVVLSPASYNKRVGLLVCCPITSQQKGYPFEVKIDAGKTHGVVLSDQVKSLDWRARHVEKIGKAQPAVLQEVISRIEAILNAARTNS